MGIKNLMKIIKKYVPEAITLKKIYNYENKVLAIDANLMLYKIIYAVRKNGYDLKNNDIIVTHIHVLLQKLIAFNKYNIIPVFVFDGMAPLLKKDTLEQRKEFQNLMKEKYTQATTQDEKKKFYFMRSAITMEEIKDSMELIKIFGYQVITAKEEADAQLAQLYKNNLVDYIVTDDMDILVFGGGKILKNFTVSISKKTQEINLNKILLDTNLTINEFIDLSILLGCDYCPTITGLGTMKAYNLIKKYGNIENIIDKTNISINIDYNLARNYFKNPPVNNINQLDTKHKINQTNLYSFLKRFEFSNEYINKLMNKLI